uniref:Ovule protein n=1 Tax=Steinernema glaseri TaxID=37863 RepID=A0A1I7YWD8_9BILA
MSHLSTLPSKIDWDSTGQEEDHENNALTGGDFRPSCDRESSEKRRSIRRGDDYKFTKNIKMLLGYKMELLKG